MCYVEANLEDRDLPESRNEVVAFAPLIDVPYPSVRLSDFADPIPVIVEADEFRRTTEFFAEAPSRSLLSPTSQALLYSVVRNLRPDHVVEIGTYHGGTAEILSRALDLNGQGTMHTVSPFDPGDRFAHNFPQWPEPLRRRTIFYPTDSMAFFMQITEQRIRPGLVLIDGNHDFEYAAFDIWSAARSITPGGFIFVDNISQAGPYRAGTEFLGANPGWSDCGWIAGSVDETKAFDRGRSRVFGTDFFVLRAPFSYMVGRTPTSFGEIGWHSLDVSGITLWLTSRNQVGTLKVQCIVRAFSVGRIIEVMAETECIIDGQSDRIDIPVRRTWELEHGFIRHTVEPWFYWLGGRPLDMAQLPTLF
jgi:hypothetical protein